MPNVPASKLRPLKKRKLGTSSLHKRFGAVALPQLPATLGRRRLPLPDQLASDFCTAFGEAVSSGFRYGVPMSAEWQTAMESRFYGFPILEGADAAGSMDATILNASLPARLCDRKLTQDNAAEIADWHTYDPALQQKAAPFPPGIPYKVDGPYDVFDNIRSALYQAWLTDRSVVKVFGHWYASFNEAANDPAKNGWLETPTDEAISLHRYNFVDFGEEDGRQYLLAALTQGPDFGDDGYLKFPRECVNFLFANIAEAGLGLYIAKPASFNWPTTIAFFRAILARLALRLPG